MSEKRKMFTKIAGVTDRRRLPRLGRIGLGVKIDMGNGKSRPTETDYLVVPQEIATVIEDDKPKRLQIMFPNDDEGEIFPNARIWYGRSKGWKCIGDGVEAQRVTEVKENGVTKRALINRECPCEKAVDQGGTECKMYGMLRFFVPEVSVGGVYQITTSSINSIIDINSSIAFIKDLVGRVSMLNLCLYREPTETHHDGKKQIHYTLKLKLEGNINDLRRFHSGQTSLTSMSMESPVLDNPALEPGPLYTEEEASALSPGIVDEETGEVLHPTDTKVHEPEVVNDAAAPIPAAAVDGTPPTSDPLPTKQALLQEIMKVTDEGNLDGWLACREDVLKALSEGNRQDLMSAVNMRRSDLKATPRGAPPVEDSPPASTGGHDKEYYREMIPKAATVEDLNKLWSSCEKDISVARTKTNIRKLYNARLAELKG